MEYVQVLIAGGGMAGLSAAIWCERLGLSCVLIEKTDRLGGQLTQIRNHIWDLPPRTYADGPALLGELLAHDALKNISIRCGEELAAIDPDRRTVTTNRRTYHPDWLIIATGVSHNQIPALAHSPHVLQPWFSTTAEAETVSGMDVAVIGGGDRAAESACNLARHARSVHLLVRSNHLRARRQWTEQLSRLPSLTILWETEVVDCREEAGKAILTLRSARADTPAALAVDRILPRIGVHGNSDSVKKALGADDHGYLLTDPYQQTEGAGWVYAIGDVANGAEYASLALAAGQAMKAVKHISLQTKEQ